MYLLVLILNIIVDTSNEHLFHIKCVYPNNSFMYAFFLLYVQFVQGQYLFCLPSLRFCTEKSLHGRAFRANKDTNALKYTHKDTVCDGVKLKQGTVLQRITALHTVPKWICFRASVHQR